MNELTINLDSRSKKPLYEQIYDYIKSDIQNGRIPYGEKLPSTRALAKHLEVSRSTIELAYEQLLSEGYLESEPCRGYFVAQIEELYQLSAAKPAVVEEKQEKQEKYRFDFTPNGVDLKSFPYNVWRKLSKDILIDDRTELFRSGDSQGEYGFRNAICNYLYQARGVHCTPEQILIGAGSDYILMLLSIILGKNHRIAFEDPTYKQAYHVLSGLGYETVPAPVDKNGLRVDALKMKNADIAYVTPSHQYPTGIVMPLKRRLELLRWANEKEGRFIIEDDYDSELRLAGKPIPSLQSIDVSGKVIYINTFAKTLCSTVRISYMVLPEALAEKYYRELSFYSCTVSNFEQYTLAAFMNAGAFEKHINRLRNYYQHKRDLILSTFLREPLGKYITISEEDSGVHFLMHVNTSMSEQEFLLKTRAKGIRLATLSSFYNAEQKDSRYENTYVMNYSFVDCDRLEYVAQTLYKIIHP